MTLAAAARMRGIGKAFNGVRVLDKVDFDVEPGEIHALVGGNGAGKSTLMKILEGVYTPDEGTIELDGRVVVFHSSRDARAAGIAMMFQEFSLVPTLTVAQNVFLMREAKDRFGFLDDRESERRTRGLFQSIGLDVDPRRALIDLPTAYQQLTEIAKALSQDARLLIMDEPTSSLARTETLQLFALMRRLKEQGISIVYISHRMQEVFEVADRVTILRDGRVVMTEPVARVTLAGVIAAIVGRKVERMMEWRPRERARDPEVLLEVRGLVSGPRLRGVDLQVRRGEIVGLAGLMGSGRSELARAIFGIDPLESGEILLNGRRLSIGGPQDAIAAGIGLIPEDRRDQGLIVDHAVRENLLLAMLRRLSPRGFVDDAAGDRITDSYVRTLDIQTRSTQQPVRLLSGGNQQKVVIAKWLATDPQVLIMDEPTAGVDIGTKGEIVGMIRAFADRGNGVIFISSELPELLAVSDRVMVMRDGRLEGELDREAIKVEEDLHRAVQGVR